MAESCLHFQLWIALATSLSKTDPACPVTCPGESPILRARWYFWTIMQCFSKSAHRCKGLVSSPCIPSEWYYTIPASPSLLAISRAHTIVHYRLGGVPRVSYISCFECLLTCPRGTAVGECTGGRGCREWLKAMPASSVIRAGWGLASGSTADKYPHQGDEFRL